MKKVLTGFLIIIVAVLAAYFYLFHLSPDKRISPINVIPRNAAIIVDLDDPLKQWEELTSNKIWEYLKTNTHLAKIGVRVDSLNAKIEKNKTLWGLVAARPMVVSVHAIRKNKYDYLYVVDLQEASKLSFVKNYINKFAGEEAEVVTRNYHGGEIIEVRLAGSQNAVYLNFNNNLLVVSTTHTLIEQSIDQGEEPVIARNLNYIDVSRRMDDDQPKIYLQHAFFEKYMQQWFTEEGAVAIEFMNAMIFTGINFKMLDDHLAIDAYSNIIDSATILPRVLHQSGSGKMQLAEIAPNTTSFFASIGFDNALDFYANLEKSIASSSTGDEYLEDKRKLEKFLDISFEEHFLSWIDDEIGVIQLHAKEATSVGEFAVAVKYKDADEAKEKLDFIKKQIKKKTPVKFKGITYKGYDISFLSVKGFFKVMFGKAFSKIDKPYYTIMENFVLFSNHPATLGRIIDAYQKENTLSNNKAFEQYFNRFQSKSTLFAYLNPEQLIIDSKAVLDNDFWEAVEANREYIECFPMIGLQISPDDELFKTQFIIEYMNPQEATTWNALFTTIPDLADTLFQGQPTEEESIQVSDILPDDLNDKSMTHNYGNGQLKFEVGLKDGKKNGAFHEYDSSGNIIIKGRYKDDKKNGVWKYFDAEGNVVKKERH